MTETLTPQRTFEPAPPPPPDTKTPRKVTVADVLERAADLLGEFGWCQGDYCQGARVSDRHFAEVMVADRFCVAGALIRADAELGGRQPEDGIHMKVFFDAMGFAQYEAAEWNDAPGRTKTEVISALRAAASSARTKEEGAE